MYYTDTEWNTTINGKLRRVWFGRNLPPHQSLWISPSPTSKETLHVLKAGWTDVSYAGEKAKNLCYMYINSTTSPAYVMTNTGQNFINKNFHQWQQVVKLVKNFSYIYCHVTSSTHHLLVSLVPRPCSQGGKGSGIHWAVFGACLWISVVPAGFTPCGLYVTIMWHRAIAIYTYAWEWLVRYHAQMMHYYANHMTCCILCTPRTARRTCIPLPLGRGRSGNEATSTYLSEGGSTSLKMWTVSVLLEEMR